jgi:methyl-accepting chemotaxis protein
MKSLNDIKIGVRLNIILISTLIIVFISMGIFILKEQRDKIIVDTDLRMFEQVDDIVTIIDQQLELNQEKVKFDLVTANNYFYGKGNITESNEEQIEYDAINQITKDTVTVTVNKWIINNEIVQDNNSIVDNIQKMTGSTSTIFQKIPQGYLRISTNIRTDEDKRAVGTFIPNDSPVIKKIESGETFYGRAFVVNDWYLTAYEPITIDGKIKGILYVGIKEKNIEKIKKIFQQKRYFKSGYPFMVDKDGTFIIHPKKEGENFYNAEFFQQLIHSGKKKGKTYYKWEGKQKYQYFKYMDNIEAYVSVSIYESELMGIVNEMRLAIIIAILLGIIIFGTINYAISKNISNSLKRAVNLAEIIASGDLNEKLEIYQKDEIGQLAKALNEMTEKLKGIVRGIIEGAEGIAAASQEVTSVANQLSEGATEQASSVEQISATMEEISSNIEQNNDNAQQAEQNAEMTLKNIGDINSKTDKAVEAQRMISEKIQIITDIAFQTNILALNAAVEAARAGESGKGFAVVATEVKKLAQNSKVAAEDIVTLVKDSLEIAENTGVSMKEAMPNVEKNTNLVQEISAASNEQTKGVTEVNNAIAQLGNVAQNYAASSEVMASNAEELASQALEFKNLISYFRIE